MKPQRLGLTLTLICVWLLSGVVLPTVRMAETAVNTPTSAPSFGLSVSIDGDTAIVGAPGIDLAYAFYRNQGDTDAWGAVKDLWGFGDWVGCSVSVSGDIAIVGVPAEGVAYVFYRNQGGANSWGRVKTIQGIYLSGEFGRAVSISGDTFVVGAREAIIDGKRQGAAYIYQRNQDGTDKWGLVKQLIAADGVADDWFGYSVSISGDVVAVGAIADIGGKANQGAAYVFYRDQGGANQWGQVKKLVASDGAAGDFFGNVSNYADKIVVGAWYAAVSGKADQGAAYVFYRDRGGANNWGQVKKIIAADGAAQDYLGNVSIYGDTIVIGAQGADIGGKADQGAAYVFYRDQGGADNWGQVRKITAADGASGDHFGRLQVNGNTLIVGVPNGEAAYVFYRDQGGMNNWGQVKKLSMPPTNPTSLTSPSHAVNVWSKDNTVDVTWSGASDIGSGLDGYSILWDTAASTMPDTTKDLEETAHATTSPPLANGSWYFHIRAVNNAGNWAAGAAHLGPFKIDTSPPSSRAFAPEFAISPFEVWWNGIDTVSGIASYDIGVRDGLAGTWTEWLAGTSAVNGTYTDITAGHTYYFRSQAHDAAGNLETDLPPDGDTHTTVAAYQVTGQVLTNRHQPIFNATVTVDPPALNVARTDDDGHYTSYFAASGTYSLTAARDGFGLLPPQMNLSFSGNATASDFVLPPVTDAVTNGSFEAGDLSGWTSGPTLTATVELTAAHTGGYGLRLASSGSGGLDFEPSITQSVAISSGWSRPTLSWLYQVTQANPGDAFLIIASNDNAVITATLSMTPGEWLHDWVDLSAFSGQTVTLRFGFQTQAAGQELALDEVSLGESIVGAYTVYLPLVMRSP